MKNKYILTNGNIVNENRIFKGSVVIEEGLIKDIIDNNIEIPFFSDYSFIDVSEKFVIPGVIDDQVHFREPGLTHKGDIYSESKAAVAGGITSFMEMPNTVPQTITQELLEEKYNLAAEKSLSNYSFYMGVTNDNADEVLKTNPENVCGIKIFLGASTGNMLVDNIETLKKIFSGSKLLIAVHCEDESIIRKNIEYFKQKYAENIPVKFHPEIRSREACLKSSSFAVELAKKHGTRLHILHLSTEDEIALLDNSLPLSEKRITAEVCVHHLYFSDKDYEEKGTKIKWNPAIKTEKDRISLLDAVINDKIDVIATDHAPHTLEEKNQNYLKAPSGGPLVQHSLVAMLELVNKKQISIEKVVEKMCHNPAILFRVQNRGYIRKGYYADITVVDNNNPWIVEKENILYKCKWSPFEKSTFNSKVLHTFVNGNLVYSKGEFFENIKGKRLKFNREA
jgi:dihydroorotase